MYKQLAIHKMFRYYFVSYYFPLEKTLLTSLIKLWIEYVDVFVNDEDAPAPGPTPNVRPLNP